MKPHKGRICNITPRPCEGGLGYYYRCQFLDHPLFAKTTYFNIGVPRWGHTSCVVKDATDKPRHIGDGIEIETENSRYTIVEDPKIK